MVVSLRCYVQAEPWDGQTVLGNAEQASKAKKNHANFPASQIALVPMQCRDALALWDSDPAVNAFLLWGEKALGFFGQRNSHPFPPENLHTNGNRLHPSG
jgi:hypothetical protein